MMSPRSFNDVTFFMQDGDKKIPLGKMETIQLADVRPDIVHEIGGSISTPVYKREAKIELTNAKFSKKFLEEYIPSAVFYFYLNKIKNDRLKLKHVEFTINKDSVVMKFQNKVHRKSRINKKWAKRYGFTETTLNNIRLEVEGYKSGQRFRFDTKSLDFKPVI